MLNIEATVYTQLLAVTVCTLTDDDLTLK